MPVAEFPASAANSLIVGYCDDFVSFATVLAQTLEQISMRGLDIKESHERLARLERGMRDLADAVRGLVGNAGGLPADPAAPPSAGDTGAQPGPPAAAAARPPAPAASNPPGLGRPIAPSPSRLPESATGPTGAAGGRAGAESATLKGTNHSMPLLSVVQFLGRMRKHGVLHVQVGDETMKFELVNGIVQRTASTRCPPDERLGGMLVELGFCEKADMERLVEESQASRRAIGDAVLEAGMVSHGQLLEVLEQQVHRRFARANRDKSTSYWFEEKRCGPTDGRVRVHSNEIAFQHRGPSVS